MAYFRQIFKEPPPILTHFTNMDNTTTQAPPSPYGYTPSIAISIIGALVFFITSSYLVFQYFRTKCWFLFAIIIGALSR